MGAAHSYTITVSNNKTEKEGLAYLLSADRRFINPSKEGRTTILRALGLDKKFARAFDLILVEGHTNDEPLIEFDAPDAMTLIELKTTKKKLPMNPKGFFFGATKNEFDLAEKLGSKYKFAFVCLHPESTSYALLSRAELEKRITTKRVQYQINLG
jgi:hypothetical protein